MSAETGRPTMHEVARVAGVSHATVSRVLNGHTNVAPATARAVADAIITTGYVRSTVATSPVHRHCGPRSPRKSRRFLQ